jgi:Transcriptional regulator PadR-like family
MGETPAEEQCFDKTSIHCILILSVQISTFFGETIVDNQTNPRLRGMVNISLNELKMLTLLSRNPGGLFGSQFIHLSNGFLTRGSTYTGLARLQEKGFIGHEVVQASPSLDLDRPLYKINPAGEKLLTTFAEEFGCTWRK